MSKPMGRIIRRSGDPIGRSFTFTTSKGDKYTGRCVAISEGHQLIDTETMEIKAGVRLQLKTTTGIRWTPTVYEGNQ